MLIALPKAADALAKLEGQLSAAELQKWFGATHERNGSVSLPRFSLEGEYGLKQPLKKMGMPTAFEEEKADFSGIAPERGLFISDVIHKAIAEVNEEGTVAAAATAVVVNHTVSARVHLPPFVFRADHPFLFLIYDAKAGNVLFLGRVASP